MMNSKKNWLVSGIVVGMLLAIAGLALFLYFATPSKEEIKRASIQRQSAEDQKRLGIDCKTVDSAVISFLNSEGVKAMAADYADLATWQKGITPAISDQTRQVTELVRNCSRIYDLGEKGQLNGLSSLRFATLEVFGDLQLIETMLKHQVLKQCDEVCLRNAKMAIQGAIKKLKSRIDTR